MNADDRPTEEQIAESIRAAQAYYRSAHGLPADAPLRVLLPTDRPTRRKVGWTMMTDEKPPTGWRALRWRFRRWRMTPWERTVNDAARKAAGW